MMKKKSKGSSHRSTSTGGDGGGGSPFLFQRGNMGLARLLVVVNNAGRGGISTVKLLERLGSTHHAKAFIKRAEDEGLIKRVEGESPGPGQFKPVYNILTEQGKQLLQSQLM